ncbi:MAG: DUF167 domain-containing protein [Fimbriimonadaceae bacterium]
MAKESPRPKQAEFRVRVNPRASQPRWEAGDPVRVWVTVPPAEGQANEAVIQVLAGALGIARSNLSIVRGLRSRDKVVRVRTLAESELRQRLGMGE